MIGNIHGNDIKNQNSQVLNPWIWIFWFRPQNFIPCLHPVGHLNNSTYVLEIPNDAYTTLIRNLIGCSTLSQMLCKVIVCCWEIIRRQLWTLTCPKIGTIIYAVVWMAWNSYPNCSQMWMKKLTKTRYTCSKASFYCFKWFCLDLLA